MIHKSSHLPKHRSKSLIEQNTKDTSKTTSKHVKSVKFIKSDTVDQDDVVGVSDTSDDAKTDMDSTVHISSNVYTVSYSCLLGSKPIYKNTNFLKLENFTYRQFDILSVRKLKRLALISFQMGVWTSCSLCKVCAKLPMCEHDTSSFVTNSIKKRHI
jgi:hypothetical protein